MRGLLSEYQICVYVFMCACVCVCLKMEVNPTGYKYVNKKNKDDFI